MRKLLTRASAALFFLYLVVSISGGVYLAEITVHLPRRPITHTEIARRVVMTEFHAELQNVSITANDGAILRGWFVEPEHANGSAVILLHGVTDNREGMGGFARLFLHNGYSVLLPDSRAHGVSGGQLATYGVLERDDIHRWVSWLYDEHRPRCVYGMGESLGAAILVQSLAVEPRFCGAIAESPFATFRDGAYSKFSEISHLGLWFGKTLGRPMIETGLLYARLRYKIDLTQADPSYAVAHSSVPLLLIHGGADRNIFPVNSEKLHRIDTSHSELWEVPGALHTGAWSRDPRQFESRVLQWCAMHN
ncbi:Dipeptidyl aminopeptidases/acylaminoacyl-peptidases-like protein [Candidatus Koribacter versatilis Ellin345]|uniref:Dipeptidyl aminopeptidases/acylaminoacyl-peptidases-like protein n=1 Tax=Koribacter versatilis (strain Ellin345) TaxID=204669 RepID=Q1IHD6_KORVE|nr:alpha/beta hydrolase [Candidatus Koribacter versatilis]ABF43714.1 Dipeptidyl aminopeptidases/acylaminoacyl-peptidases-like protein [Candidatus Koribacter versatilis Ellin345]